MALSKDSILAAADCPLTKVSVPEWGGDVYIRTMNGTERDELEADQLARKEAGTDLVNIRARILARVMCDEFGKSLFSADEAESLGKKNSAVLQRVFVVAQKLNGLSTEAVEELEKNSGAGQTGNSNSSSPVPSAAPSGSSSPALIPASSLSGGSPTV